MPYQIGGIEFRVKSEITDKCRSILNEVSDGCRVPEDQYEFLFDLFKYHDEWTSKSEGGVASISTTTTEHGTRCFVLVRGNQTKIDISFPHAIKLIPSNRTKNLTPQRLLDYKAAARTAIKPQISAFRDKALLQDVACPYTGEVLNRDNCAVDHIPPNTFDRLLFEFSVSRKIRPMEIKVGSRNGVVAEFLDKEIEEYWKKYHQDNATLRVISKIGNLQLPKESIDWERLL